MKNTTLNLRDLPPDLKCQFHSMCSKRGRTMKGVVIAFMRDAIKNNPEAVNVGKLSRTYRNPR